MDENKRVTAEDQNEINKFARLHEIVEATKRELNTLRRDLEMINYAVDEIMLLGEDDTKVPYKVGNSFVHFNNEDLDAQLETDKTDLQAALQSAEAKLESLEIKKTDLKRNLYEKFGDQINLETD